MIKHLYIHIPFCDRICPYCDFNKRVKSDVYEKKYLDHLLLELSYYKDELKDIETIFIGGGTPTAFSYLKELLEAIDEYIDLSKIKEFTIETTPKRALDYLDLYKKYHVNRISIGVETFDPKVNKYLKREENDYISVKNVVKSLKEKGIPEINLDFIYSLPFETLDSLKEDLKRIKELDVEHISFYDLIIEEKTQLYYDLSHNLVELPKEDETILMRDLLDRELINLGYHQYEISNWAKDGYESIHNKSYWLLKDYLGVGLGAHSLVNNKRFNNSNNLKTYASFNNFDEYLSQREYYLCEPEKEYFLMGLRLLSGVSISEYKNRFKKDPYQIFDIKKLIDEGLLIEESDYLHVTKKGRDLGNIVYEEFV